MWEMTCVGKGNTAEVFEYGKERVCKLFFEGYPDAYVALEFQNAREVYKKHIKAPQPFQIVAAGNRTGIIYEKIPGKTLFSLMAERKADLDRLLNMFIDLQLNLTAHHTRNVLSYKDCLLAMLENKQIHSQEVFHAIQSLPDDICLLHGDFHPGNVLIMPDGTPVIIDFMNVCRGPALYDIARTYFLIKQHDVYLADKYLKKIGTSENDLTEYLNVIAFCRQYEG